MHVRVKVSGVVSEACVQPACDHSLGLILACDQCSAWHELVQNFENGRAWNASQCVQIKDKLIK